MSDVALADIEIVIKGIASSWTVHGQQVVKEKRGEALSYGGYPSTLDFNSATPYGCEHRSNHGLSKSPCNLSGPQGVPRQQSHTGTR